MSHTKEPWRVTGPNCILGPQLKEGEKNWVFIHCGCCGNVMEEEDMERAVACVNACANLPAPEKNIRELVAALSFAVLKLTDNGIIPIDQGIIDAVKPFCLNPSEETNERPLD